MAEKVDSSEFQGNRINTQICAFLNLCAKKGCPVQGSLWKYVSLFSLNILDSSGHKGIKKTPQPVYALINIILHIVPEKLHDKADISITAKRCDIAKTII